MPESADKLARVRAWLKTSKKDGVVFSSRANFAWLTGGGDNHIVSQSERGFASLVVTARQALMVTTRIEYDRVTTEEPLSAFTPKVYPWTQSLPDGLAKILGGKDKLAKLVSDDPDGTGLPALPGGFYELRAPLGETETRRYKALGRDCALALETVARQLTPGDSEHQVEADLARHLLARGIQPFVLLVAFDQRIQRYRHPTPGANHLRRHAMLVVCGLRHGLIASLTRFIHVGQPTPDLLKRHESVCRVEAALWEATTAGRTYGEVFKAGMAQYAKEGFKDEWELHHQGGPTGYAGRDFLATPDEKRPVVDGQAVAWNPSITGTKTEDTFILSGKDRLVITASSPDWPTVTVTAPSGARFTRPAILVR